VVSLNASLDWKVLILGNRGVWPGVSKGGSQDSRPI
jgi:hypothetical protein